MRHLAALVLGLGAMALGACASQRGGDTMLPAASATVVSLDGTPLAGATVRLVSQAYPNQYEKFRMAVTTDRDGVAAFPQIRKWKVESLGLHRENAFIWNWCVRLDGYLTVATFDRDATDFDRYARFVMYPGESTPCPAGP
jgi:hypothetical protein